MVWPLIKKLKINLLLSILFIILSLDLSDISQHSVAEGSFLLIGLVAVVIKQKIDLIWEIILYGIKSVSVVTLLYIGLRKEYCTFNKMVISLWRGYS